MFGLSEPVLLTYALIVVRLSSALVIMPMFGASGVPPQTKLGLALFLALILVPLQPPLELAEGFGPLLFAAGREAIVGLAIGFAVLLVFQGLELAGSLVGLQMGMGLGEIFDPITGARSNELRRFYSIFATLVFFLVNAHHQVLTGLFATFEVLPLAAFRADDLQITVLIQLSASIFIAAVRIALPVMAAVFITDIALGVLARTMPQLNVLIVGLPLKVAVGLFVLMTALPATTQIMSAAFGGLLDDLSLLFAPAS